MLREAEDVLEPYAVHPRRRSRVPGPSAPPEVPLGRVHVRGDDVGLNLIPVDVLWRQRMRERIDHLVELECSIALVAERRRENGPQRGMRVLRSVLPNARQVSLDVAGVVGRLVERRREQHQKARVFANEMLLERRHRAGLLFGLACIRDDAPALCDRVDAALVVLRRA